MMMNPFISKEPTQIEGSARRNQECPQCGRYYLTFPSAGFKGDQSVCQVCADKNFSPTRDKMQKIERVYADALLSSLHYPTQAEIERESRVIGPFLALSGAAT